MLKSLKKYGLKIFSILILIGFISSITGLNAINSINCKIKKTSACCCKDSDNKTFASLKISKKCCCELNESSNQPADINAVINESSQKNFTLYTNSYSDFISYIPDFTSNNLSRTTSLSPAKEDIYIINSNFRI